MNLNDNNAVLNHPITKKEQVHTGRARIGYHLFLSQYFSDFNSLARTDKAELLVTCQVWEDDDTQSCDSVLTPRIPTVYDTIRSAACKWRSMPMGLKKSWGARASQLNRRPRKDGTFQYVPSAIATDTITQSIMQSLTLEWQHLLSVFMNATIYATMNSCIHNKKQYRFGNEIIVLNHEKYRNLYFSHLLKLTLFGSPLFSTFKQSEIAYRTKKVCVIHIFSFHRIKELFSFGGRSLSDHSRNDMDYIMCGRASLLCNGKEIEGRIINESNSELMIMVDDSDGTMKKITVARPIYDIKLGQFSYCNTASNSEYQLLEVSPLRFKINQNGKVSIIFNQFALNKNTSVEGLILF